MNTAEKIEPKATQIVIIGGGPGGSACALALQRKAAELGKSIVITLIEGKQFLDEKHYNQCVGVLSPPLPDLLESDLGIPFPMHLCQVDIQGYVLHSSKNRSSWMVSMKILMPCAASNLTSICSKRSKSRALPSSPAGR